MKKIFIAALVGVLTIFSSVACAEVVASNSDITFCGYGSFAQRKIILRSHLESHPDDAKAWHELGQVYYALEEYSDALAAFNKAVQLEPNNKEFKRDRDLALAKVRSGAGQKNQKPKIDGLG